MTIWTPALAADKPAYIALADAIARDRAAGALRPGTKLPPHRTLAHALGLTVGTITRGYAEATRRGLVRGEVGRGTFVIDSALEPPSDSLFVRRGALGDDILNLTITRPVLGGLTAPLRAALAALAEGDIASFVDYGPPEGLPAHRTAIADWLGRRGAPVVPEQIAIASGAQNALALAAAGLLRPGDAVAVDPLTYPGFKTAAGLFGLNLVAVAGDGAGMDPAALADAARSQGVAAVYLMPNLHNPTMTTMPAERRREIVEAARAQDLLILEDDVYGFLVERPPPLLAALAPERTALIGSVSKFMAPGLRIGWIASPAARAADVASAVRGLAWMASPLLAEIATKTLASPAGEGLVAAQRAEAAARMAIVKRRLGRWLPAGTPDVAMHAWLPLPEPWRADQFVSEAEARRIAVTPAGAFAVGRGRAVHAVRFGLGAATQERLDAGMARLAALLAAPPRAGAAVV